MAGYTRTDTTNNIADGNIISATDLDNEFDGIQVAFNSSTGHNHDGTTGEGAPILVLGPTQDVVVGAATVTPKTTNTVDIGSGSLKFKDLHMAGNALIGGTLGVTGIATFTAQPVLSSLTASRAVFTDGSKGLVSNAITGTGNVVMSASPTLTGTIGGANATLSGTLAVTGVATFTAQPIVSSLTASRAVFSDGSKGLVSNAITGTGNVVMSAAPTLTGTINAEALTLSGAATLSAGTANGVAYLNASKVLTTGSALVYDGSSLTLGSATKQLGVTNNFWANSPTGANGGIGLSPDSKGAGSHSVVSYIAGNAFTQLNLEGSQVGFYLGTTGLSSEQMRLTSTGLGIGTSSPGAKLDVAGEALIQGRLQITSATPDLLFSVPSGGLDSRIHNDGSGNLIFGNGTNSSTPTERMRLDSSGNLGLGVTPSAWSSQAKALEIGIYAGFYRNASGLTEVAFNSYQNTSNNDTYRVSANPAAKYQIGGAHAWHVAPSGTAGNAITFTQAMTLDASGNLLVGLTSSSSRFHVDGGDANVSRTSGNSRLLVTATGVANTAVGFNNSGSTATGMPNNVGYVNVLQAYPLVFGTDSTERMRIASNGIVTMSAYGAGAATFSAAGVISSVSDETWKIKDGVPVDPDSMLKKLEPGYWYYNDEKKETFGADRQLGFYAQNVNAAIGPEAAPEPEEGKPWGYYDRSVLAVAVMSLQKALATIESLEARIATLESKS